MPPVFPFFFCFGRSGGSLVRAMFNAHPDMAVPEESFFVAEMARLYLGEGDFTVSRFVADLGRRPAFRRWRISDDDLGEALAGHPSDYPTAIRCLYSLYARRRDKTRYADRTNVNMFAVPTLATAFPEARFVHLVRDGRDVALSWQELPFGLNRADEVALHWVANVVAGRRAGRWLGAGRYAEVHYEQLVQDPEPTLRRLCEFIELPYEESMLSFFQHGQEVVQTSMRPDLHGGVLAPLEPRARQWRRHMAPEDVAAFEAFGGDLLAELGYELTSGPGRPTYWC